MRSSAPESADAVPDLRGDFAGGEIRFDPVAPSCDCERCAYCDGYLARRHEHDHFPVPKSLGGTETVPVCLSCHDLKNRTDIADWPPGAFWDAFQAIAAGPPRLLVARLMSDLLREKAKPDPEHPAAVALRELLALNDELREAMDAEHLTGLYPVAEWTRRRDAVEARAREIVESGVRDE